MNNNLIHPKLYTNLIFTIVFALISFRSNSQTEWILKKEKNGIKVYTGKLAESKFNAIKVSCNLKGSLSALASILLEPEQQPKWVMSTKTSSLIKQLAPNHIYYYSIANLPWPITNRDMVIDLKITQDSITKKMTIAAIAIDKILPAYSGLERIPYSHAIWEVTPIDINLIHVDYTLKINPGGGLPAWLVNLFSVKAPYETFDNLSKFILDKKFQTKKLDFLKQ